MSFEGFQSMLSLEERAASVSEVNLKIIFEQVSRIMIIKIKLFKLINIIH